MKEIPLSKRSKVNRGKYKAIVDNEVFEEVNKYSWTYQKGYARNNKMNILLHRYIWSLKFGEIPSGLEVEHKNQDKLDCRLENLRLANRSENNCNKTKQKNNKSGFKGICKVIKKKEREDGSIYIKEYWHAEITKDYRKKTEKRYTKDFDYNAEGFEQAKKWYKEKSLELHKKFSIYNKDK
jgi:hypothetical protein